MISVFQSAGFKLYKDKKYLNSSKNLTPGDILLYPGHHTATNVCIGENQEKTYKQITEKTKMVIGRLSSDPAKKTAVETASTATTILGVDLGNLG